MKTKVRIGLAGLGFMAATHLRAYRQVPGAEIVALYNPSGRLLDGDFSSVTGNLGDAEPLRLNMDAITGYRDFESMLRHPGLDMIDICAPTQAHPQLAMDALRAGKHVLCEKPLARTSMEARQIAEAAASSKGFLMPAMCLRFWPEWSWLREAIADERFGRVLAASFRRVAEPPGWGKHHFLDGAKSGGGLLDIHIHDTDFILACFGRPRSVHSTGYTKVSGAIDHIVTQYQVESGAMVYAEGGWAMSPGFGFNMAYTVNFEQATADYDFSRKDAPLKLFRPGSDAETVSVEKTDGYVAELRYFIDCISRGASPRAVTAENAVEALAVCEAEERSIATGQAVKLAATS